MTEQTARRLIATLDRAEGLAPVRHLRGNQIASAIIGSVGLALFFVGVENAAADIPVISNAYGSICVGLVLLAFTGALLTRLGHRDARAAHRHAGRRRARPAAALHRVRAARRRPDIISSPRSRRGSSGLPFTHERPRPLTPSA
jgi:hypothetical protein